MKPYLITYLNTYFKASGSCRRPNLAARGFQEPGFQASQGPRSQASRLPDPRIQASRLPDPRILDPRPPGQGARSKVAGARYHLPGSQAPRYPGSKYPGPRIQLPRIPSPDPRIQAPRSQASRDPDQGPFPEPNTIRNL